MSREIKFRAWDEESSTMIYPGEFSHDGFYIEYCDGKPFLMLSPNDEMDDGFCHPEHREKSVIMQFTGLKDKNSKEVYEGDILKGREIVAKSNGKFCTINPTEYYEVIFNKGQFAVKNLQSKHLTELPIYHFMFEDWMDVELVGNKFENHELLEANNA